MRKSEEESPETLTGDETVNPSVEISEDLVINKDYYNVISKNQFIECIICLGLLNDPETCSQCENSFCKLCIFNWRKKNDKCPMGCKNPTLRPINRILKGIMDEVKIKCSSCNNETTVLQYPKHQLECTKIKCFACNSIVSRKNVKVLLEKGQIDTKFQFDPIELTTGLLTFQIYVWIDKPEITGFIRSSRRGWLKLTRNRDKANYFTLNITNNEPFLQIYHKDQWSFIEPHYDLGVGVYSSDAGGSIRYDMNNMKIISNSGRTNGSYLTMRLTNNYFYFYKTDDIYKECSATFIYS